jgi:hypothetical protein
MRHPFRFRAALSGAGVGFLVGVATTLLIFRNGDLKACRVHMESIQIADNGKIQLKYSILATSGTTFHQISSGPGGGETYWELNDPWFGPMHGSVVDEFGVDEALNMNHESLVAGLRVEAGRDYALTSLSPLELFRVESADYVRSIKIAIR